LVVTTCGQVSSGVEVRIYPTAKAYSDDAAVMAAHGWRVVGQSSERVSHLGRALILAAVGVVAGLFVAGLIGALIGAVVLGVVGNAGPGAALTVTYQYVGPPPPA
jgi:hypothetical protein